MIVGIDFDRVLFNTDAFNEYLKEKTGLHHVDGEVHDDNGNYDLEKHARLCGVDPENVYQAMRDLERFLYDDVEQLEKLENVVIVTRGEEQMQEAKIENSGVLEYVPDYIIVEEGSKDVGIDFLVDDWEKELERVDVPGMLFDREKHSMEDVIKKVREREKE
ncbi:MAG: hypothetical protein ABEJ69_00575 [Candidatus Nanohaloarchaea archaeon]